ncbi:MAG: cytochrome-c oxidase, cbb3-type subunit III [Geminicoccaceae bacterium]|nr:cytochrome-c oxidase, cbb3-type subunit III [Geminicoccaceae bacterium]
MSAKERDHVTGVETTGHEWDGIKELNNPLPAWWLYTFYVCIAFAVLWWVLYPSWPTSSTYLGGVLGYDQRQDVRDRLAEAREAQGAWRSRIAEQDPAAIIADPELLTFAVAGGEVAFKENCAPCHGLGGAGQLNYPTLADDAWIWGGTVDDIEYTVRHGIRNADDDDARYADMPAYGDMFDAGQIEAVADHVLSFTSDTPDNAEGATLFAENCAACHAEDGGGDPTMGAPALNDAIWLYGEGRDAVIAQVTRPRQGVMPAWQGRLSDDEIKMLTVYVHSLGGGQ